MYNEDWCGRIVAQSLNPVRVAWTGFIFFYIFVKNLSIVSAIDSNELFYIIKYFYILYLKLTQANTSLSAYKHFSRNTTSKLAELSIWIYKCMYVFLVYKIRCSFSSFSCFFFFFQCNNYISENNLGYNSPTSMKIYFNIAQVLFTKYKKDFYFLYRYLYS